MSKQRQFATGSVRDNNVDADGKPIKPRPDLISPHFIERFAWHLANGAYHYGERNWEKGQPKEVIIESLSRHILAIQLGKTDEDHISAAAFGLMALAHFEAVGWPEQPNEVGSVDTDDWEYTEGCECRRCVVERGIREDEFAVEQPDTPPTLTITIDEDGREHSAVLYSQSDRGVWLTSVQTVPAEHVLWWLNQQGLLSKVWTEREFYVWLKEQLPGISTAAADGVLAYLKSCYNGAWISKSPGTMLFRFTTRAVKFVQKIEQDNQ